MTIRVIAWIILVGFEGWHRVRVVVGVVDEVVVVMAIEGSRAS